MHVGMLVDVGYSTCSLGIAVCAAARNSIVRCQWLGDGGVHVFWWLLDFGRWGRDDKRDFSDAVIGQMDPQYSRLVSLGHAKTYNRCTWIGVDGLLDLPKIATPHKESPPCN